MVTSRVCILQSSIGMVSETFLRAQSERLPGVAAVIYHSNGWPYIDEKPILSQSLPVRAARVIRRRASGLFAGHSEAFQYTSELTKAYAKVLRRLRINVMLAQYGTNGVRALPACERTRVPLVVHFHGFDASRRDLVECSEGGYQDLFSGAAAFIAVSAAMREKLIAVGAPEDRTFLNPYGVDTDQFVGAMPESSAPTFVAVGRFVDKKAPHLLMLAIRRAREVNQHVRLRIIGTGPLENACRDLTVAFGMTGAVDFLGEQTHDVVAHELRSARAFVQHSVTARNGDCEGLPLAVLEAAASGLPVISTRHAGIPHAVDHGVTGFLVEERDVEGMSHHIATLAEDARLAGALGRASRDHIIKHFSLLPRIQRLSQIVAWAADNSASKPEPDRWN